MNGFRKISSRFYRIVGEVVLIFAAMGIAQAQPASVKQPAQPAVQAKPTVRRSVVQAKQPIKAQAVLKPVKPAAPDLKVGGFSVNQSSGKLSNSLVSFSFSATVENAGDAQAAGPYYLSFEEYNETRRAWEGGRDKTNCIKLNKLLQAKGSFAYSGTVKFLSARLSGQTIRVRATIDAGCFQEFPPAHGNVKESDENNNFSNEVTVTGGYYPVVTGVTPQIAPLGSTDQVQLSGTGFGKNQDTHAVILSKDNSKTKMNIKKWTHGVIYFTIPNSVDPGVYQVFIGDKNSLTAQSNPRQLKVTKTTSLAWATLLATWDLFNDNFSVKLNTYGGRHKYKNTSTLNILKPQSIDIPNIKFKKAGLHYLSLIKDLETRKAPPGPDPVRLTRTNCRHNQFRLEVDFESEGTEIKTYNKAMGPAGRWCDGCLADIHINNGKLNVLFTLSATNGKLDYQVKSDFKADIKASNKVADAFMNAFLGNWNSKIRKQVEVSVDNALMSGKTKPSVIDGLTSFIRLTAGLSNKTITDIAFARDALRITYY